MPMLVVNASTARCVSPPSLEGEAPLGLPPIPLPGMPRLADAVARRRHDAGRRREHRRAHRQREIERVAQLVGVRAAGGLAAAVAAEPDGIR